MRSGRHADGWFAASLFATLLGFLCLPHMASAVELAEGLAGEWTFEEGEGDVARDTSDNNNNGLLKNGPKWVDDGIGKALLFDGVDDYVDCGATDLLDITEQISLEAWVNPNRPSTGEPLIVGKGIYCYGITWTGTTIIFYITAGHLKCQAQIPMKQWSHVVGTYDGRRMRLYINGEQASGFIMPEPGTPIRSRGTSVMIGRTGKAFFPGMIDNARVYSRPLSATEVKAHYLEEKKLVKVTPPKPREKLRGLALKIFDIGKTPKSVRISGTETVESNLTVPANVHLMFDMGGMLNVLEGVTVTLRCPFQAPLTRIFTGKGQVIFGRGSALEVYPQWWGAKGDGIANDTEAVQAALDSRTTGGIVRFPAGTYNITKTIEFYSGASLYGPASIRSRNVIPALLQSKNPAARSGVWIERMGFSGRSVDGENSRIGINMTNVCSSRLIDVSVSSCDIGIKVDGPYFCGYNRLFRVAVGDCRVGIEMRNSTIATTLIGSQIGAVETGILVATANQLEIFDLTIEGFRKVGIDVQRGDTIHMYHLYFANGVESGTGIKIAKGVSECTIVNPRYSRVAVPIDNQATDTLILDNAYPSELLRTKSLFAKGISSTKTRANNLCGSITISGAERKASVKFALPERDADYRVVATCVGTTGEVAPGARTVFIQNKSAEGFDVVAVEPPGEGNTVTVDWILIR